MVRLCQRCFLCQVARKAIDAAKGVAAGAKVTVYYTEKAGKNTVEFFKA